MNTCQLGAQDVYRAHIAKQDAVIEAAWSALGCIPVYYEEYIALKAALDSTKAG